MKPGLIIVSNRLPVSVKKVNGHLEFFPSIGGLATGLAAYTANKKNKWIGWPGIASNELTEKERQMVAEELRKQNCYPVFLSQKLLDNYYNGYSNSLLWPLFHQLRLSSKSLANEKTYWKAYQRANAVFAEAVLAVSSSGSDIWIHDYQLMLLPAMLHLERPHDKIGFFLHTPFPPAEKFSKLTEGEALIAGVLGSDLVGLHTENYVQHFLETVQRYDSGIVGHHKVILRDRVVRVTDFPIGIDYQKYQQAIKSQAIKKELRKLQEKYRGKKVILCVDRLDPAKGLVERAKAYGTFLRQNPRQRGKLVMVMLVVPSRTEIPQYQNLKARLEKLIDAVNQEFGNSRWQPIDYIYDSLPFEKVTALYRRADVAFIVPLRDGMNLVAKEFLASRPRSNGVLILSTTAGAAEELKEAVLVDPSKPNTLVDSLQRALAMPRHELRRSVKTMKKRLASSTIDSWAGNFTRRLQLDTTIKPRVRTLNQARSNGLVDHFRQARRRVLLLDYDGVLVPFKNNPQQAKPSTKLLHILARLASQPHTDVVIISGRKQSELGDWLSNIPVYLIAEHGAFVKDKGKRRWQAERDHATKAWQGLIRPIVDKYVAKAPGSFIETKKTALVWHYRRTNPYYAQKYLVILKRLLKPLVKKLGLEIQQGNMILEIKSSDFSKASAALAWLKDKPDFMLVAGDDYTDEAMFNAMTDDVYTIHVGRGRTYAKLRAKNYAQIINILAKLAKA